MRKMMLLQVALFAANVSAFAAADAFQIFRNAGWSIVENGADFKNIDQVQLYFDEGTSSFVARAVSIPLARYRYDSNRILPPDFTTSGAVFYQKIRQYLGPDLNVWTLRQYLHNSYLPQFMASRMNPEPKLVFKQYDENNIQLELNDGLSAKGIHDEQLRPIIVVGSDLKTMFNTLLKTCFNQYELRRKWEADSSSEYREILNEVSVGSLSVAEEEEEKKEDVSEEVAPSEEAILVIPAHAGVTGQKRGILISPAGSNPSSSSSSPRSQTGVHKRRKIE